MNDFLNTHMLMAALRNARFVLRNVVGGVVLPANNGPIYAADTRNPLIASGLSRIQGCH